MFTYVEAFPGVRHITDAMGVSMTLVEGTEHALLIDAGYGTEDVASFIRTLTERPVSVLLTHGHHDHVLGARWFPRTMMSAEDLPVFRFRTARAQREAVRVQAAGKGLPVPEDFLTAPIPDPDPVVPDSRLGSWPCRRVSLGGVDACIILVPGHTPGSCVVFLPSLRLLITGDNWNPCTWMWFEESAGARIWRDRMVSLLSDLEKETGISVAHILCSHQPKPRSGPELKEFLEYMTDERLRSAPFMDMNSPIRTHAVTRPDRDWTLLFDMKKLG